MRDIGWMLAAAGFAVVLSASPAAAAMTVEEVIAKNIEARGGVEKWKAIKSLEATGELTSFSKVGPFTLRRTRDRKYFLDTHIDGKPLKIGYDGNVAWTASAFFGDGSAQRLKGADLAVMIREIDFPSPFFDYKEQGHEVKLVGEKEFEGQKGIAIEVKRKDGQSETWYLDPKTYLEIGRESPGSDFGRPVPLRTFYDDFRVVSGVRVPYLVESQWYTRERIFHVSDVKMNVEMDEAQFKMPPPPGMEPYQSMAGDWNVAVQQRGDPSAPFRDVKWDSKIQLLLGGAVVEERYTTARGNQVIRSLTYDRFRKHYKVTEVNELSTFLDILDGNLDDQKRLIVSNMASGTSSSQFGQTIHGRLTIKDVTSDSFTIEEEASLDGGKEWFVTMKAAYTRAKK